MDPPSPNLPFTIVGTIRIRQRDAELALLRVAAAAGGYTPGEEDVGIPTVIFTSKKGGLHPPKMGHGFPIANCDHEQNEFFTNIRNLDQQKQVLQILRMLFLRNA